MTSESEKWDTFLDAFKEAKDKNKELADHCNKILEYLTSKRLKEKLQKELKKIVDS